MLRQLAAGMLRDALGRRGLTTRDVEILVDWSGDDVLLRRAHIGHEWSGNGSLGNPMPVMARIRAESDERRAAAAVERFVRRAVALHDRQRALADHLEEDAMPAWSVLVDACALALLRHAGWPDPAILRFHRPSSGRYTVGEHGFNVGMDLSQVRTDAGCTAVNGLGISAAVLTAGRIRFGKGSWATYLGGRTARIEIETDGVPQTVLEAMRGKPLSGALGHPAFEEGTATVTSARVTTARSGTRTLSINLARRLVPMAPAPAGVETPWLRELAAN